MRRNLKIEDLSHHVFDLLHAWVAEFEHLAAVVTDQVIVLFVAVAFLVLGEVFTELVLLHEVAAKEQFQRVVDRCAGNAVVVGLHVDVKRLGIEVVAAAVDLLQDGVALGRTAGLALFQVGAENVLYGLDVGGGVRLHDLSIAQLSVVGLYN